MLGTPRDHKSPHPTTGKVLLQLLPDFREAYQIMESNTITLKQAIEITLQPPAVRILIQEYLQNIEDNAGYLTEHIEADSEFPQDVIAIFKMPWSVVMAWGAQQGLTGNS